MQIARLDVSKLNQNITPRAFPFRAPSAATGRPTPHLDRARKNAHKLWRPLKAVLHFLAPGHVPYLDRSDVVNGKRPKVVGCETINVCNANCSFCGYGKGIDGKDADPRVKGKLDEEVYRHTLKLYSESGGGSFSFEPILGEITANPNWLEMVSEARRYPNITGVTTYTNGILLHRYNFEKILKSGLTVMNISSSLAGRDSYRRLYGVDKFDQVVKNILGIIETNSRLGSPVDIHILLRIDKPFSNFYNSKLYKKITRYLAPNKILILDDEWDDFRGIIDDDGLPEGHKFKPDITDKTTPCYALFRKLQVLTDGTIQACACRVEPELWGGKITGYDTLEEAWRDPRIEEIRDDWFNGKLSDCCKTCSHYEPYTNLVSRHTVGSVLKASLKAVLNR
jgi:hypothetical protein